MHNVRNACFGILLALGCMAANAQSAADEMAQVIATLMLPAGSEGSFGDWQQIEASSQIRWQALPPNMLDDALPDGSYFTRRGIANLGGLPFGVVATGARTMVTHVYFRNVGATPVGETVVVDALRRQGFALQAARCPLKGVTGAGGKWWRISGRDRRAAFWNSQTDCNGRKCESYALLLNTTLPSMTPEQQRLYTDHCADDAAGSAVASASASGTAASPVPAAWDVQLAALFMSLIPARDSAGDTTSVAWSAIDRVPGVRWAPMPPQQMPNPPWPDTGNHHYRGGQADLGGRVLYLNATGSAANVVNVHVEDQTTQARRGDVLQELQRQGLTVELARCGIVYQLSSSRWYRVTGAKTRPVMLLRNVRCDTSACPKAQENYTLSLTGELPPLKSGEVDAVGGRCPGR